MSKKKGLLIITLSILLASCSAKGSTSNHIDKEAIKAYPNQTINMIIPFGEGSASDAFVRQYSQILSERSDVNFQPINKDGSSGLLGMLYTYQQNNDGYNVLEITPSQVIADNLDKSNKVKLLDDFEPLVQIQSDIYVLSVAEDSPIKNYDELIEKGKKDKLTIGGTSSTGLDDFATSKFKSEANINSEFIPYKSGSEVKAAALGGEVDVYLDKVVNVVDYVKSNKVRPLVIFNDDRINKIEEFKSVPTTKEKGLDVDIGSWRGFVIKKGTPEAVKKQLTKQLKEAYETEEYKTYAKNNLVDIGEGYLGPDEFEKKLEEEYEKFDEISDDLGI
ncbi:tripartite tricarboxylate transporter substrate binding protein [Staphylococcus pseudoxylosus]|uniref:Bug family tripartite tricarboxylate transporter substrate binding protein n=1 Tax=Staphylococcus pseudoxylosus TaxID=2282419 RepID=UPI002DBBE482|nr:tripartite tricarboxylate transporter substrate binding protein [Staphylococcus pseudoxylosus]MEB6171233.1 tripartite tricarboxylate transporter substrate binding protein [Staphylococcus pseudoxylosus]